MNAQMLLDTQTRTTAVKAAKIYGLFIGKQCVAREKVENYKYLVAEKKRLIRAGNKEGYLAIKQL